tara:strand:+ start:312 stop:1079 length:768 start_codon:yes stop_codon:yes gene_type:complete
MKFKQHNITNQQNITSNIWNDYYVSQEKGNWVGNQYPTEPLIRYISNLRKSPTNKLKYFNDTGREIKLKKNFHGKALEIGFGTLANLIFLNEKGFKCSGLEVSKNSVMRSQNYIKENKIKNIQTFLWENSPNIPFPANSFDMVVGLQCVYYNLNFNQFLSEVRRILKPNGKFFFSFFSDKHDYIKYIDVVDKKNNLIKWNKNHPNKRIRGSVLFQPKNKKHLLSLFKNFRKKKIFTYEFDQLPLFQSWWYINGIK